MKEKKLLSNASLSATALSIVPSIAAHFFHYGPFFSAPFPPLRSLLFGPFKKNKTAVPRDSSLLILFCKNLYRLFGGNDVTTIAALERGARRLEHATTACERTEGALGHH